MDEGHDIIDWAYFEETRRTLGPGFIRILGYFREDGMTSLMRRLSVLIPTLKPARSIGPIG